MQIKAFVLFCGLACGCGHQNTNGINEAGQEVFQAPENPTLNFDAGTSTEDRSASDAGLNSPSDLDGGSPTASSSVPSPADYPDTPDTTTCIPQYPEDEGVSAGLTPLFIWQSAFGAQEYKFELAKDSAFNELIFVNQLLSEPLTERYFQLPDTYELTPSTTYFWRVHSVSNNVSALCTRHFSFQTP